MKGHAARTLALVAVLVVRLARSQEPPAKTTAIDPFRQQASSIALDDQAIIDGAAKLSQAAGISVSVEFPLSAKISQHAPPLKLFTVVLATDTVSGAMDKLCDLDPTFTWIRLGNTANIFPRALRDSPDYLLNRRIESVRFEHASNVQDAIFQVVAASRAQRNRSR